MKKSIKKLPEGKTVLCLRSVNFDGTSYNNFKWPVEGFVEALDFSTERVCGQGLHGYLRGCGEATQIKWDGLFQVVKVLEEEVIDLDGKVKFPRCEVIFTGTQKDATDILIKEYPCLPVIGATVVVGDNGTATAGYKGTAIAGNNGKAIAGDCGTATTGYKGTATAGNYGTATAGNYGTATAGNYGTATAGSDGTATAGYYGTATAGNYGTAIAGDCGTATAGNCGRLIISWYDAPASRYRFEVAYVGENGIEANVAYKLNDKHLFVKA